MHNLSKTNYGIKNWIEKYSDLKVDLFKLKIHHSWDPITNSDKYKELLNKINNVLTECIQQKASIFPYPDLVFNALNLTPLKRVKIVIIGQDPYFNAEKTIPQAMGLSFSVPKSVQIPPSLVNIYHNLYKYGHVVKHPSVIKHGNLSFWAYQGCLMLNSALTVQEKCPNSHKEHWEELTDLFIQYISDNKANIVFMLWGLPALSKLRLIDAEKHKVIISSHPSPLSYTKPLRTYNSFISTDHFGEANKYLEKHNKDKILFEII